MFVRCTCLCMHVWEPALGKLRPPSLFLRQNLLLSLDLTVLANDWSVKAQSLLVFAPQYWDCRYVMYCPAFHLDPEDTNQVLMPAHHAPYQQRDFPQPLLALFWCLLFIIRCSRDMVVVGVLSYPWYEMESLHYSTVAVRLVMALLFRPLPFYFV